jgi:hypothetical protein
VEPRLSASSVKALTAAFASGICARITRAAAAPQVSVFVLLY